MPGTNHDYVVTASSTTTFGRVMLDSRNHHIVVDGPVANGCPGEALTPAEIFLGGVATCAVELVGVMAKDRGLSLSAVTTEVGGTIDRAHEVRSDVTVFSFFSLHFTFYGVGDEDAASLVAAFKGR